MNLLLIEGKDPILLVSQNDTVLTLLENEDEPGLGTVQVAAFGRKGNIFTKVGHQVPQRLFLIINGHFEILQLQSLEIEQLVVFWKHPGTQSVAHQATSQQGHENNSDHLLNEVPEEI